MLNWPLHLECSSAIAELAIYSVVSPGTALRSVLYIAAATARWPAHVSEATAARFRAGTLARVDAVLEVDEKRADFFRDTVEAEIKRRERKKRTRRKV